MEFLNFNTREKSLIIAGASFAIASFVVLIIFLLIGSPLREESATLPREHSYEERMALLKAVSDSRTGPELSESEKAQLLESVGASEPSLSSEERYKLMKSLRTP